MKRLRFVAIGALVFLFVPFISSAQQPGDTVVVEAFNFNSSSRDTTIVFPDLETSEIARITMLYSLRCKDGEVNNTGGNDVGCGEFALMSNTFIHDFSRTDSAQAITNSHEIAGFQGTEFNYIGSPTFEIFPQEQESVEVTNVISEETFALGGVDEVSETALPTQSKNAKAQYLILASELGDLGFEAGEIDALDVMIDEGMANVQQFRCKLKPTSKTTLDTEDPDLAGWTQVFYQNREFQTGSNRLQFTAPFNWDGNSNIIVEFSYSMPNAAETDLGLSASSQGFEAELASQGDGYHIFDGTNYIEASGYKGISGNNPRTIEAWIKTGVAEKEIVSWGTNNPSEKWTFRVNETGELRAEVSDGNIWGTTVLTDNEWHHVACVFEGDSLNDIILYVDGQPETIAPGGVNLDVNTNTAEGINLRISRGVNNRYFDGFIDEVRVWDVALSEEALNEYLRKNIDSDHPNIDNLVLHYDMNAGQGFTHTDLSGSGNEGVSVNGGLWGEVRGADLYKGFNSSAQRPFFNLVRGEYEQTTVVETVNDTIFRTPNGVTTYGIESNEGTNIDDEIIVENYQLLWEATNNVFYNLQGEVEEVVPVSPEGTISITDLPYMERRPMRFELHSQSSPFGLGLDMGEDGKTWTVDVSDFAPILNGSKRLTIERGGEFQEDMDISFLFHIGTPPQDVLNVQQIWRSERTSEALIDSGLYFEPRSVLTLSDGSSFKVRSVVSGQTEGIYTPTNHQLLFGDGAGLLDWEVWKECALNPLIGQGRNWADDRAGWCPGAPTDLQEFDVSEFITPGDPIEIDYDVLDAPEGAVYNINHQLVTYGPINHNLDAAVVDVRRPSNKIEYENTGVICETPQVVIQNLGSETLTSCDLAYYVNDISNSEEFSWTGSLEFMESEVIDLPVSDEFWSTTAYENNLFHVMLAAPNGNSDEIAYNNTYASAFDLPGVVPEDFIVVFQTNDAGSENRYEITDAVGNVVFERSQMEANTLYEDTIFLNEGCYTYRVYDEGDNGLEYDDNPDGVGFTRFKEADGTTFLFLEGNFGRNLSYGFTINEVLETVDYQSENSVELYPNPSRTVWNLEWHGMKPGVRIAVFNAVGQLVDERLVNTSENHGYQQLDISNFKNGVYFIRLSDGEKLKVVKAVVQ
ncbi:MAG: LamG-like jellyroll fold domain-containing protein [Cryomorphaceae bacterium]